MMELKKSFPNVTLDKLVEFLLKETAQAENGAVNPQPILEYLKLNHYSVDLSPIPPEDLALPVNDRFRALLYYPDKLLATEHTLTDDTLRFSVFHEIAHYVLPNHQESFFLCLQSDLEGRSVFNKAELEKEANHFAAEIMFNKDFFSRVASDMKLNAMTIKTLKEQFKTSIEATARHLIEKTQKPALLVVYAKKPTEGELDPAKEAVWDVKYCIPSKPFKRLYGVEVKSDPANEKVKSLGGTYRDLEKSLTEENIYDLPDGRKVAFDSEYFTNSYNVFRIMIPKTNLL